MPGKSAGAEWRIFGVSYSEYLDGVVKTDNRPAPVRAAETAHINIGTCRRPLSNDVAVPAGRRRLSILGRLAKRLLGTAGAALRRLRGRVGWQPAILRKIRRGCARLDCGSGDSNPNDGAHGTFFQVPPRLRAYSRFPFFNMMNSRDDCGELILHCRANRLISISA